jgi:hypothetical protein
MSNAQKYNEVKKLAKIEIGEFYNVFLAFLLPNAENSTLEELTSAASKILIHIKNN